MKLATEKTFLTVDAAKGIDFESSIRDREVLLLQIIDQIATHPFATPVLIERLPNIHKNFNSLLLVSPSPALFYRYGGCGGGINFHSLGQVCVTETGEMRITHFWKGKDTFIEVQDTTALDKFSKPLDPSNVDKAPMILRRIDLLNDEKEQLYFEPLKLPDPD